MFQRSKPPGEIDDPVALFYIESRDDLVVDGTGETVKEPFVVVELCDALRMGELDTQVDSVLRLQGVALPGDEVADPVAATGSCSSRAGSTGAFDGCGRDRAMASCVPWLR